MRADSPHIEMVQLVQLGDCHVLGLRDGARQYGQPGRNDLLAILSIDECVQEHAPEVFDAGKPRGKSYWNANRIYELEFHDDHPSQGLNKLEWCASWNGLSIYESRNTWVEAVHGFQFVNEGAVA